MPAGGGRAVQLTKDGGRSPLESPDGDLLYLKTTAKSYELRSLAVNGRAERLILSSGRPGFLFRPPQFAFALGGLFYIRYEQPDQPIAIEYMDPKTGVSRKLLTINRAQRFSGGDFSVSPDSKSFLYSLIDFEDDLMQFENFH